jgi:hypothetical protein
VAVPAALESGPRFARAWMTVAYSSSEPWRCVIDPLAETEAAGSGDGWAEGRARGGRGSTGKTSPTRNKPGSFGMAYAASVSPGPPTGLE